MNRVNANSGIFFFFFFWCNKYVSTLFGLVSWDEVGGNLKRCLAVSRMCDPKLQVLGSLHDAEKCFKTSVVGASACLYCTVGQRPEDPGPGPDVRSAWKVQHPWFLSLVSTCGMRVWGIPAVPQPALYWVRFPGMGKEEREACWQAEALISAWLRFCPCSKHVHLLYLLPA